MGTFKKVSGSIAFLSLILAFSGPTTAHAATAPALGSTSAFGVVSNTFTNSNTPPQSIVNGSVCGTTLTVPLPLVITGGSPETPCNPLKGTDQTAALAVLNGQACTSLGAAVDLNAITIGTNPPGTFPPGCYSSTGTMNIVAGTTVTLNATAAGGDGGNVWIFRPGDQLTTAANSLVLLANGANANNVFWAPVGATTLGANATLSLTPTFVGTIFRGTASGLSITLGHFANLLGRALAFGSTVTTDANTITVPTTLHVIKLVVNGSGGTAIPANFTVHVKDSLNAEVGAGPFPGASAPGTSYALSAGTYTVSEDANPAYVQTFLSGACATGSVILATGDDAICTIVNTDIPAPSAPVPGPGPNGGSSFTRIVPLIGIIKVPSPLALSAGPGSVTYGYTVWNVAAQQALVDVTVTDDKCGPVTLVSGDVNSNGKLDVAENWKYSCTTTLASTTTNTAIATGYSDDAFHEAAIATAISTVAVGVPVTPPLISIVKVPSRLTPFPFGGGNVTYTYTVTNPGVVAMHGVTVVDDRCGPVSRISGDSNGDNLLDPAETWTYTCQSNVPVSTRNVATAQGSANGFTALGYAFATVLVSAPSLPNTGFAPDWGNPLWNIIVLSSVVMIVSAGLVLTLKKQKIN